MTCDFAARAGVIVDAPEIIAVGHRRERAVERKNFETVSRQIKLANDLGTQQGNNVRADGKLEARKHFFGHRRAAEHMTALEHQNFFSGARKISGINQTVMSAANHDDVVFVIGIAVSAFADL